MRDGMIDKRRKAILRQGEPMNANERGKREKEQETRRSLRSRCERDNIRQLKPQRAANFAFISCL